MKLCPTCLHCYEDDVDSCRDETHEALTSPRFGSCVIDGKYRLIKRLGHGGMGAVYEAAHLELDRRLAIKILVSEYISTDPHARWRLRQEALTACNFDHPNLVRLYDFGTNIVSIEENGRIHAYDEQYIVMELLRGKSLKELLDQQRCVALPHALAIALQIAEGLAEIHSKGIVYRDLKPANILICSDYKGDLLVKIVDFGAVKLRNKSSEDGAIDLTKAMFVGSPIYASPENCKGEPLDERSDIYSLGLILYEMIAGYRPFEAGDFLTLLNNHVYAAPKPLTTVSPDIADLIMRALGKEPGERPQTAQEFAASLRVLNGSHSEGSVQSTNGAATERLAFRIVAQEVSEETVIRNRAGKAPEFTKLSVPVSRTLKEFRGMHTVGVAVIVLAFAQGHTLSGRRPSQNNSQVANVVAASIAPATSAPATSAPSVPVASPTPFKIEPFLIRTGLSTLKLSPPKLSPPKLSPPKLSPPKSNLPVRPSPSTIRKDRREEKPPKVDTSRRPKNQQRPGRNSANDRSQNSRRKADRNQGKKGWRPATPVRRPNRSGRRAR